MWRLAASVAALLLIGCGSAPYVTTTTTTTTLVSTTSPTSEEWGSREEDEVFEVWLATAVTTATRWPAVEEAVVESLASLDVALEGGDPSLLLDFCFSLADLAAVADWEFETAYMDEDEPRMRAMSQLLGATVDMMNHPLCTFS